MSVIEMPGAGGLRRLVMSHPDGGSAEVYLHGAHITSWTPARGAEWLFLSRSARFNAMEPIRGGIPVVFPQFAERGSLPKHGLLRTMPWIWTNPDETDGDSCRVELEVMDTDATRALWPHRFRARLTVELGSDDLTVALDVQNTDEMPCSFTAALHSYFRVDDVRRAAVAGLQGSRYLDKPAGMQERTQIDPLVGVGGELDRVYRQAPHVVSLIDDAAGRELRVAAEGFDDVVVWNPWQQLAAELQDLGAGEYLHMLCIEAAQAVDPIELAPGASWRGTQNLRQIR
jgi:glucose-6-phosphate 1-epimerase